MTTMTMMTAILLSALLILFSTPGRAPSIGGAALTMATTTTTTAATAGGGGGPIRMTETDTAVRWTASLSSSSPSSALPSNWIELLGTPTCSRVQSSRSRTSTGLDGSRVDGRRNNRREHDNDTTSAAGSVAAQDDRQEEQPYEERYDRRGYEQLGHGDGGEPTASHHRIFTDAQLEAYRKHGFLVVSGLLLQDGDGDLLDRLARDGHRLVTSRARLPAYFSTLEMGVLFDGGPAFRKVALQSKLPQAAAELMGMRTDDLHQHVRVLRDVFMSKSVYEASTCDWHVDDQGFWPETFHTNLDHDERREGVNAWIAMQDMPADCQGSMALASGSHRPSAWRDDAYAAIGQNRTSGDLTVDRAKAKAARGEKLLTTCEMRTQAPVLSQRLESMKFVPDLKRGDVIFATRRLFHRTLAVTQIGKEYYERRNVTHLNRYSIRYVRGDARLPSGWPFEWSVLVDPSNLGRSIDQVDDGGSLLWYPRAYPPTMMASQNARLDAVAGNVLQNAKARSRASFYDFLALFREREGSAREE